MKLRILGAAGEVTGSNYMIETAGYRVLVDCGTQQGADEERHEGESFPYDPTGIDAVLLTHAHIDHSGRIPLLVKLGFKGKIYCTHATAELVEVLLRDSARIMKEDAEWRTRKNARKGLPPVEPLYSERDVEDALAYRSPLPYDEVVEILPGLGVRFREAGHILGSAIIETWISEEGMEKPVKVVFSGDLGPLDGVIEKPPAVVEEADFVLIESTYGDRLHRFSYSDTLPLGIKPMAAPGHTPGHTVYQMGRLLVVGDLMHGFDLQIQDLGICPSFDMNPEQAVESRKKYVDYARENKLVTAGMHFPGNGIKDKL